MARITVIVPVYKVEQYLERCVKSILAQTYMDFELVLVDDGSPDQCGVMCERYAKSDSRIIVLHRANGGLSAARNTGIEWMFQNSQCEYVTFVDSDDWIHPQYLENLLYAVEKNDVPVSICCQLRTSQYDERKMKIYEEKAASEYMSAEELLVSHEWNFNYAWGKLYRKEFFKDIRYPEGKNFEDTFTTYRILFLENKVAWVNRELYFYFLNNEGISRSPWTPGELVILDGMRQQMEFYRRNGYKKALEKEEKLYVNHHAYQICRIRENKAMYKENERYLCQLRREMMKMVQEHPEKFGYKKMPQCYEAAYPNMMKIYHKIGSLVRRGRNK